MSGVVLLISEKTKIKFHLILCTEGKYSGRVIMKTLIWKLGMSVCLFLLTLTLKTINVATQRIGYNPN